MEILFNAQVYGFDQNNQDHTALVIDQGRISVSLQPIHATLDRYATEKYWGERAALAYAWHAQLNAGAALVFGSDAPIEAPNPFCGFYSAVTRRRSDGNPAVAGWHPEQCLTMAEALQASTTGAAYVAGRENELVTLTPGYFADLIVLDEDPFHCPPENLLIMESTGTMINGEWVWQKK